MYTLCVYFAPFCSFTALYWQCFRFSTIIHTRLTETQVLEPLSQSQSHTHGDTRRALGAWRARARGRPPAGGRRVARGEQRHPSLYRSC